MIEATDRQTDTTLNILTVFTYYSGQLYHYEVKNAPVGVLAYPWAALGTVSVCVGRGEYCRWWVSESTAFTLPIRAVSIVVVVVARSFLLTLPAGGDAE